MKSSKEAVDLILESEGVDQPYKWPGGGSGVTIGFGYDLGFESKFEEDWSPYLSADQIKRLKTAHGVRGRQAAAIAHRFDDIRISRANALDVFIHRSMPREEQLVLNAFPGSEDLPPSAFGALTSIVFNRGAGMQDDPGRPKDQTRREMRAIRDVLRVVAAGTTPPNLFEQIAADIRSMKRLWAGKGLDGLITRREKEAQLVESAIGNAADTAAATAQRTPA